jgi:hypothetical protein
MLAEAGGQQRVLHRGVHQRRQSYFLMQYANHTLVKLLIYRKQVRGGQRKRMEEKDALTRKEGKILIMQMSVK